MPGAHAVVKRIDRVRVAHGLPALNPHRLLRPLGDTTTTAAASTPGTVAQNASNAAVTQAYQLLAQGQLTSAAIAELEAQAAAAITASGLDATSRNAMIGNVNSQIDQLAAGNAAQQKTIQAAQASQAASAASAQAAATAGTVDLFGYTLTYTELGLGAAGLALVFWLMTKKK